MIHAVPAPSPVSAGPSEPAAGVRTIWMLARPGGAMAMLAPQLEAYGYRVMLLDPAGGPAVVPREPSPDALILEAAHPELSIMPWVRAGAALPGAPAMLVVDHGFEPVDRILVLEAGADDCVGWPCGARELVARLRAIARRRRSAFEPAVEAIVTRHAGDLLVFAGWTFDRLQRRLARPGRSVETLPFAEFTVLDQLLRQPRRIVSREALLEATAVGDAPERRNLRAIDIQVSRLRKRLEIDGDEIIRTVRGHGYMLLPPVTPG